MARPITPKISVAMTTYNGERHLKAQLDSIAHQSVRPFELVACDDGSSDATIEILESFREEADFDVRIVRNPQQLGILENFFSAFSLCRGEFIAYCDQDDVWRGDRLARIVDVLRDPSVSFVCHPSVIVDENLNPTGEISHPWLVSGAYPAPHFPQYAWGFGHQMVFRRELVQTMNAFRLPLRPELAHIQTNQDDMTPLAAGMLGTMVHLPEPLVSFRRHSTAHSPAGLEESRASRQIDARMHGKVVALERTIQTMHALIEVMEEDGAVERFGLGAARHQRYIDYLRERLEGLQARLGAHTRDRLLDRMGSVARAVYHRAYEREHRGRARLRQLTGDLLAVVSAPRRP